MDEKAEAPAQEDKIDRARRLSNPEFFSISISGSEAFWKEFSPAEQERIKAKLSLVANQACRLAAGMVYGTVKYADDSDLGSLIAGLIRKNATATNYGLLIADAYDKTKAVEEVVNPMDIIQQLIAKNGGGVVGVGGTTGAVAKETEGAKA